MIRPLSFALALFATQAAAQDADEEEKKTYDNDTDFVKPIEPEVEEPVVPYNPNKPRFDPEFEQEPDLTPTCTGEYCPRNLRYAFCMLEANPAFPELNTKGYIRMREMTTSPLIISGFVAQLPMPYEEYGFSINENGWYQDSVRCEETGAHWSPTGDLTNLRSNAANAANYNAMAYEPTLFGENSIIGKSMVVYDERDDSGNGGTEATPIACCHIKMVQVVRPTAGSRPARTSTQTRTRTRGDNTQKAEDLGNRRRLAQMQETDVEADEVQMTPEEFEEVFGFMPDVYGDDGDLFFGQD